MTPPNPHEIRKHYYLDRYVIIAPARNLRPDTFAGGAQPHTTPVGSACVFCHNDEPVVSRLPATGPWQVKSLANAFPILHPSSPKGYGHHEVILETHDHALEFSALSPGNQVQVLRMYVDRIAALSQDPGVAYVQVWKNDGPGAAASIAHAHSQVLALPLVPPAVQSEFTALAAYRHQHGTCALCEVVEWEETQAVRLIWANAEVVVIAPYAASAPYGAWVLPRRHVQTLDQLSEAELASTAQALGRLSRRLDDAAISFNWFVVNGLAGQDHHLMVKVEPRITVWAGAELGTGIAINPVAPEATARWYNEAA